MPTDRQGGSDHESHRETGQRRPDAPGGPQRSPDREPRINGSLILIAMPQHGVRNADEP